MADYTEAVNFYNTIKYRSNWGNMTYTACKPVGVFLSTDQNTAIGIQLESGISVPVKPSLYDRSSDSALTIIKHHYYPGFNELEKNEIPDPRKSETKEFNKFWTLYYEQCRKVADSKQKHPKRKAVSIMNTLLKKLSDVDEEDIDRIKNLFKHEYEHYDKQKINYFRQQIDTNQFNEKLFYETRHKTFDNMSQELKIHLDFDNRLKDYINKDVAFI